MEKERMSLGKSLIVLIPVIAYLGILLAIYLLLGLKESWIGFLLMWYWGMEKQASFEAITSTIFPGALVGLGVSYLLHILPNLLGTIGLVLSLTAVLFIVICTFTGWLKKYVNGATFLFLTVLSIPTIAGSANYIEYLDVIIVSSIYIGVSSWLMTKFKKSNGDIATQN